MVFQPLHVAIHIDAVLGVRQIVHSVYDPMKDVLNDIWVAKITFAHSDLELPMYVSSSSRLNSAVHVVHASATPAEICTY